MKLRSTVLFILVSLNFPFLSINAHNLPINALKNPQMDLKKRIIRTEYPLTITDDLGNEIVLSAKPTRIVSLAPSCTELVFAVSGGSLVVGVDDFSDYPPQIAKITRVGGFTLNKEIILALTPDLVLAADTTLYDTSGTLDVLAAENTPVVFLDAANITGILHDITLLGRILDNEALSIDIFTILQNRVNSVIDASALRSTKPKVYLDLPSITAGEYFTFGPGSFGDDLVNLAQGTNIAASLSGAYPQISAEFVIASNPDIIIFTNGTYFPTTVNAIKERTGWYQISAVKNDYVYAIDENLVQRPGPRIVDGLEQINLIISEWYNNTVSDYSTKSSTLHTDTSDLDTTTENQETTTVESLIISGWTIISLISLVIPVLGYYKKRQ